MNEYLENRSLRRNTLTWKKMMEYLPVMTITNLSTLLLLAVDGLVVGNFNGAQALEAVNLLQPYTIMVGVLSVLMANGIATTISKTIGENDGEKLLRTKTAAFWMMWVMVGVVAVVQIPILKLMMGVYDLSPEVEQLSYAYAVGIMISNPLGLISCVGTYEFQILGKMKYLMKLAILEGLVNLALDLLFVGGMKLGVAGAGYGTAGANVVRVLATIIIMVKYTDMYKIGKVRFAAQMRQIIKTGIPNAVEAVANAVQSHFMMVIITLVMTEAGAMYKGVNAFTYSVAAIIINGIVASIRPLLGLLAGADDKRGMRSVVKNSMIVYMILCGAFLLFVELLPEVMYIIHGVGDVDPDGLKTLRIYAISILFTGLNAILQAYFINRGKIAFVSVGTFIVKTVIPLPLAFVFSKVFDGPWVFLSYVLANAVWFAAEVIYYRRVVNREEIPQEKEWKENFYLNIDPDDAVNAKTKVMEYLESKGLDEKIITRIGLSIEEIGAYATGANNTTVRLMIRLCEDELLIMLLDDGECISLTDNAEELSDNYALIKSIFTEVKYQYILDMNYTTLRYVIA